VSVSFLNLEVNANEYRCWVYCSLGMKHFIVYNYLATIR